jgi:hypothetical protein
MSLQCPGMSLAMSLQCPGMSLAIFMAMSLQCPGMSICNVPGNVPAVSWNVPGAGWGKPMKEKPRTLVCVLCDKGFKLRRSLGQHVAAVHPGDHEAACPSADSRCSSSSELLQGVCDDRSVQLLNGSLPLQSLLQLAHSAALRHTAAMNRWLSRQGYE